MRQLFPGHDQIALPVALMPPRETVVRPQLKLVLANNSSTVCGRALEIPPPCRVRFFTPVSNADRGWAEPVRLRQSCTQRARLSVRKHTLCGRYRAQPHSGKQNHHGGKGRRPCDYDTYRLLQVKQSNVIERR